MSGAPEDTTGGPPSDQSRPSPGGPALGDAEAPAPVSGPTPAREAQASSRPGPASRVIQWLLAWGPVVRVRFILDAYGAAGGGILAAGLAYGAIFTLIPATLLVVGVGGFFVADPQVRGQVLAEIATRVPPLQPFLSPAVDQVAAGAAGFSIVGFAGLLWTSSQFYGQLDGAFAVVLRTPRNHGLVARTIRGLVSVGAVVVLFVSLLVVTVASAYAPASIVEQTSAAVRIGGPALGIAFSAAVIAIVYRFVPAEHVPWRAAIPPSIVVAILQGALTGVFVVVEPYLASPKIFGPFFAVFAGLAWLSWTFQVLLLGAAWVRERAFGVPSPIVRPSLPES